MDKKNFSKAIENLKYNIEQIDKKEFNVYFFVYDTKGRASGELTYIYRTASVLNELGYNVKMLYEMDEKEIGAGEKFEGPGSWMGEKFNELPHLNIAVDDVELSPCDILFIPEIFSEIMVASAKNKFPCKKVAILHNFNYIQTFMPTSFTWGGLGINDVIVTTDKLAEQVKRIFPLVRTKVVSPCIAPVFRNTKKLKNPVVNVVVRDAADFKRVVALFYWKYPMFRWVNFEELNVDMSQEMFAEKLNEGAFTVWIDYPTNFGYSALEAMQSGSIVIGKVPEEEPEWMYNQDGESNNNVLWFYNTNDVHDLLAKALNAWIEGDFPTDIVQNGLKTAAIYSVDKFKSVVKETYEKIFDERKNELVVALTVAKNNNNEGEKENTNE